MKSSSKILAGVLLIVLLTLFLTACGGGGSNLPATSGGGGGDYGGGTGDSGVLSASLTDDCSFGKPYLSVHGTVTFGGSPCGISTLNVEGPVDISSYTVDLVSPGITSKRAGLSATFASTPMTGTYSLLNTDLTLYEGTYGFNCFNQGTFSMSKD